GLKNHLQTHFPAMWRLYLELKSRSAEQPPTVQELMLASNQIALDSKTAVEYLRALESKTGPLVEAFKRASMKNEEPWDQKEFEAKLTEYFVACAIPFDEVNQPEFQALLQYTHHSSTQLHIPGATTMKRKVMKLGEITREELKRFIKVFFSSHSETV
ncbi:hypothetical protein M422DRAFT_160513, partial [Sphaerobolus stellatus SS14]